MTTVLIADDTLYMRGMLKSLLFESGFDVVGEASNGDEAVELYKKLLPDLLLLDIVMGGGSFAKSGIEALTQIITSDPSAKIVICSALDQQSLINESLKLGAKAFITKPFDPEKLLDTLTMCSDLRIISELGNIGAGRAATALSKLTKEQVHVELPKLETGPPNLVAKFCGISDKTVTVVHMRLEGEAECDALLVFKPSEASKIASMMPKNPNTDFSAEMEQSAIEEMGSNMICAFFSAVADFSDIRLVPSSPNVITDSFEAIADVFLAKQAMTAKSALIFQTAFQRRNSASCGLFMIIPSTSFQKQLIDAGKRWITDGAKEKSQDSDTSSEDGLLENSVFA